MPESAAGKKELALTFVAKVRAMNSEMGIPNNVEGLVSTDDVTAVTTRALVEANGEGKTFDLFDFGYPVPRYMDMAAMLDVVNAIKSSATTPTQQAKL